MTPRSDTIPIVLMTWNSEGELEREIMESFVSKLEASDVSDEVGNVVEDFMETTTLSSGRAVDAMVEELLDEAVARDPDGDE